MKLSQNPSIRSIDILEDRALIGTMGSELILLDSIESSKAGKIIMNGHYQGELWGLCEHPTKEELYSVGEDSLLRKWSITERSLLATLKLTDQARALTVSGNGELVAVGTVTGKIILADGQLNHLETVQSKFTKPHQWIQDIKFSPDSQKIAFGAHGGVSKVHIYKILNKKLKFLGEINAGITSALLHLDWDTSSNLIVLNSQAYELKFVSSESLQVIRASSVQDVQWHTWTCKIGFPV